MTAERSVFQRAVPQPVEHPFDGVYCADRRLNSVLDAEGLVVLNPEDLVQYPPLVHRCPPTAALADSHTHRKAIDANLKEDAKAADALARQHAV